MTIQECYEMTGSDYEDVKERFTKEERIKKYVFKFINDKSYSELERALNAKDWKSAFRFAHTLKGTCSNLSFIKLYESSLKLTDALREEQIEEALRLFPQVKEDYKVLISALESAQETT